jgi:hypothetical protein
MDKVVLESDNEYCHACTEPLDVESGVCTKCGASIAGAKYRPCLDCGYTNPTAPDSCASCGKSILFEDTYVI